MVTGVSYAGRPLDNTAMYISKKVEYLVGNLTNVTGCKVFVENTITVPDEISRKNEIVYTDNPELAYARFVQYLDKERMKSERKRKYTLTEGGYTIGENVTIGEGSYIEPGAFIGHDVVIGKNAYIKSGARIRYATIGDNFLAGENCVIGTIDRVIAKDEDGNNFRIPSFGKIVIGNNVEIGSLSCVSCGQAGNTVIGDNVQIYYMIHVPHDVRIGKNVKITVGVILGGYAEIGEDVIIGMNATIRNRITVGKGAYIGMGAVVTKSVEEGVTVIGNPAKPFIKSKETIEK